MDYKYTGIILGKKDVGEVDRIYTIYTREIGKIRVIASGVRKPNAKLAGSLETITSVDIFVSKNRGMGKITGAVVNNIFVKIKNNFEFLQRALRVSNLFERLITDQEKDEKIFDLLVGFLDNLEKTNPQQKEKLDLLMFGFIFQLLNELGYELRMDKCAGCEKKIRPTEIYFNASLGGIVCYTCAAQGNRAVKINEESVKLIRIFRSNRLSNLGKIRSSSEGNRKLNLILQESLNWIWGRNLT